MKLPKSFRHKGEKWLIKFEADLKDGDIKCDGLTDFDTKTIFLDNALSNEKLLFTFYHEVGHVLLHAAHIPQDIVFNEGVEEIVCDAIATLLTKSATLKWK